MSVSLAGRVIAVAVCAAGCAKPLPPIELAGSPPASVRAAPRGLDAYPSAVAAIMEAFEQALGLPRADVNLVLFPNRRSFEEGLLETGYPPELARSASAFAAIGGAREVFVNAEIVDRFARDRRVQLVAHELVHSLQYRFGGGTRGASEQWVREGFAEWVSFRVTEHLGLASFESQREDLLAPLSQAPFGLSPAPLERLVTFPQWVDAQRAYDAPLYAQAFLAVELLIELRGVPALVSYFERFSTPTDYQSAFTEAFGVDRNAFGRMFARRWHETVARATR